MNPSELIWNDDWVNFPGAGGIDVYGLCELLRSDWSFKRWSPTDAFDLGIGREIQKARLGENPPDGSELVPHGWEHDHCEVCHVRIGLLAGDTSEAWHSEPHDYWLCPDCLDLIQKLRVHLIEALRARGFWDETAPA